MNKHWTENDLERIKKRAFKIRKTKPYHPGREEDLQLQIAFYLRLKHSEIFFRSDFAAGIKMTIGQATKHKKMQHNRGWPDLFIAHTTSSYSGLFLELKRDKSEIYKKDGSLRENDHIKEQDAMLNELRKRGYAATFACGYDDAIEKIEQYLNLP